MCKDCQWAPQLNKKWNAMLHSPDIGGTYRVLLEKQKIEGIAKFSAIGWEHFHLTKGASTSIDLADITHWMEIAI